jgi:uncharacterized membrane protein YphA (DoxX/SURF4 family)
MLGHHFSRRCFCTGADSLPRRAGGNCITFFRLRNVFTCLILPFPAFTAEFVAVVESVGGILLILGLLSCFPEFVLSINNFVAYGTADREAL